jgi:predicted AAA+ superfamily ATPase
MIPRRKLKVLKDALARQAAVALIGPRQVGKTTLALALSEEVPSLYLDLEASEDRRKLAEPALFLRQYEGRLVVLDEIHRVPELFSTLRGLIDQGRRRGHRTGRFLLLGSASMDLLRQSGESLAGRIAHVDLGPFDVLELESSMPDPTPLWVRGGFPDSYLAANDRSSFAWRKDFIRSYLEREIPLLGPRIPAETLESLWTMLAHNQGGLLNASRLAAALMVSAQTIARYIDLLTDLLLVRRLRPFHHNAGKRIVKAPKVYVRDSGIVHSLLGIADYNALSGHPVVGSSWEGFVIENLLAAAPDLTVASFYRTSAGAEADLVLEIPGQGLWAIDIKRGLSARPEKGFYNACEDLKPARRLAINAGSERYWIGEKVESIALKDMANQLAGL